MLAKLHSVSFLCSPLNHFPIRIVPNPPNVHQGKKKAPNIVRLLDLSRYITLHSVPRPKHQASHPTDAFILLSVALPM